MPETKPGSIKHNPETTATAVKMGPGVTAGEWFVIHPDNGGHYASADEVAEWDDVSPAAAKRAAKKAAASTVADDAPGVPPTPEAPKK